MLSRRQAARIRRLLERKEALLGKVAGIDRQLRSLGSQTKEPPDPKPSSRVPTKRQPRRGRQKRGALKARIVDLLLATPAQGLTVRGIAEQLGVPPKNVHAWFSSTGKTMPQIRTVDGRRVWVEEMAPPSVG